MSKRPMRAYMAFSKHEGPEGGAFLVIHHTARQAKALAGRSGACWNVDEFFHIAVKWLRDPEIMALANKEKLKADEPHVVDSPVNCWQCDMWGAGVDHEGLCGNCGDAVALSRVSVRTGVPTAI
jgi:hypothetical protein